MNTLSWIVIVIGTAGIAFFLGFDLCWRAFVLRRRRTTPSVERVVWIPLVDHHRPREVVGAKRVTIAHNVNPNSRN